MCMPNVCLKRCQRLIFSVSEYIEWEAFKNFGSLIKLELPDDITVGCGENADALRCPPAATTDAIA